jgi:hypothetical protein
MLLQETPPTIYPEDMEWFAVRHVLERDSTFEERITLWHASSADEAIRRAEEEATEYAANVNDTLLPLFQCYWLSEPPTDGNEVFSLIRRSDLPSQRYLDTFFDTGDEFQREIT